MQDDELKLLKRTIDGQESDLSEYAYAKTGVIEDPQPKSVDYPDERDLDGLKIYGIDGSNERVDRTSFSFLLARAALVKYKYSLERDEPYCTTRKNDFFGLVVIDGNIFEDEAYIFAGEEQETTRGDKKKDVLRLVQNKENQPLLVKYDREKSDKNPQSHALGWAVKLQQALEYACLEDIETEGELICIKDGPLFSTSITPRDTKTALNKTYSWDDGQIIIGCSKRISESTLLLQRLRESVSLRDYWFPNQNITTSTLNNVSTDSLILPRLLNPGERTPLIRAVPRQRSSIVEGGDENFAPLMCYYSSKNRPGYYIRLEVPQFMWEQKEEDVKKALQIAAWQMELGGEIPKIQDLAHNQCSIQDERQILERETEAALLEKNLDNLRRYE